MSETITHYVSVSLALTGTGVQPAGFGVPAFIGDIDWLSTAGEVSGPYTSLADLAAAGAATSSPEYLWATALLAQSPRVTSWYIVHLGAGADYSDAFDAAIASNPGDFYCINIESRADADILDLAAAVEASSKIFIAQNDEFNTGSELGFQLEALGYTRTSLWYHDDDTEYLDGAVTSRCLSFNLDVKKGSWAYKPLNGIPASPMTAAQATALRAVNQNYYTTAVLTAGNDTPAYTFPGKMAGGRKIDVTTTLDVTQARLEEALINVQLNETHEVPYDDDGIGRYYAATSQVFKALQDAGHYESRVIPVGEDYAGESTPYIDMPKSADVTAATKATGVLTFNAVHYLRQSIDRVVFAVEVKS